MPQCDWTSSLINALIIFAIQKLHDGVLHADNGYLVPMCIALTNSWFFPSQADWNIIIEIKKVRLVKPGLTKLKERKICKTVAYNG